MAEVQPGSPTPSEPAATEAPQAPLEKVYTDFNIEAEAATFQPQSQPPAQPAAPAPSAPKVPDPFDPNFAAYQAQIAGGVSALHQSLQATQSQLTQLQQQLNRERTEADIKRAVSALTDGTGLKPTIAEVAMEAKAREDARFRAIWNNRSKNPAAFNAALKAFKQELQEEYTVRQDPQLVENQRAVKASQQQMATTQKPSQNDEWAGMTAAERQAKVRAIIASGH